MKMIIKSIALTTILAASSLVHAGSANIIDFEDVSNTNGYNESASFSSNGFDFVFTGSATVVTNQQWCNPHCASNGTLLALAPFGQSLKMSKTAGGEFSLNGFDGASGLNYSRYMPKLINVVGTFSTGASVSESFSVDQSATDTPTFATYSLNNSFNKLKSVTFSSSGSSANMNGFAVDNINVNAVPEPETYALLLGGLGALAFAVRGRKSA